MSKTAAHNNAEVGWPRILLDNRLGKGDIEIENRFCDAVILKRVRSLTTKPTPFCHRV